jgi:hypothetical protein
MSPPLAVASSKAINALPALLMVATGESYFLSLRVVMAGHSSMVGHGPRRALR